MRIIKYLFLLIVLALVALTVFVATQKGDFLIVKSRVIKSPRASVFSYVNDYKNWENWNVLKEQDPETVFSYNEITAGQGAGYSWKSSVDDGHSTTIFVKENDSIAQKMVADGIESDVFWKFKDTVGGTLVTWTTRGHMTFVDKISAAMQGGAEKTIGRMFEKGLANLDNNLDYEINTFSTTPGGIAERPGVMFLKQTINSKITDHPKNLRIMKANMHRFFSKNKIASAGKIFAIYHSYDTSSGLTKFSVCMPVNEEIFISPGSDTQFGRLAPMRAVKATLKGDYSHRLKLWQKALDIVSSEGLERDPEIKFIEVFNSGPETVKRPSQYITDVYLPIKPAVVRDSTRVVRPKRLTVPSPAPPNEVILP